MAENTREIKGRMKAVANIRRITRTMQMIATARFQASQKRALNARAYARQIAQVVSELASAVGGEVENPLLTPPQKPAGRELLLVVTSNRGLCGAYNANVLRTTMAHLRAADQPIDLEVVGKKGVAFFRFNRRDVARVHSQIGDTPAYDDVVALAERYMDEFTAGRYDAVRVSYMRFESASRQAPRIMQLLPMRPPQAAAATGPNVVYEFSPEPEELLQALLPAAVKTQLFQAFNEATVSEQVSRMVAMKSATDAGAKMGKELQRRYNRARQTAITTELSEIIGGAAALG